MRTLRVLAFIASLVGAPAALGHVTPAGLAADAGFTQRLGQQIPPDLAFVDEAGRTVRIGGDDGVPIVLAFAWFGCTTLCPTVVRTLAQTLARADLGTNRYRVLVASIDPRDSPIDALRMKRRALDADADAATWRFLIGRESAIATLARAAGFRYVYDGDSHQYAHPVGLLIVTPAGKISRYLLGFDYTPAQLRDALDAAANDTIGSPVDRLLLLCFHFAPTGRYGATAMAALRIASVALLALAIAFLVLKRGRAQAR